MVRWRSTLDGNSAVRAFVPDERKRPQDCSDLHRAFVYRRSDSTYATICIEEFVERREIPVGISFRGYKTVN